MLEAIRGAKQTINFASYIMKSDAVGHEFRDALAERAKAGVQVRVLLDGIGSGWSLDNSDVKMMKEAGCKFAYYHPVASWRVDRTNRRSHRRILVVDGRIGFTGGAAFSDQWSGHAQDAEHWRDTHARLEGPIVNALQASFQSHWIKTSKEALSGDGQFPALAAGGKSARAGGGIEVVFERADSARASGHVRRRGAADLDHESLLYADG